jgi:hypothetical protein
MTSPFSTRPTQTNPAARAAQAAGPQAEPAPAADAARGFDQAAARKIEEIRRRHSRVREIRIHAEGDKRRLEPEVAALERTMVEKWGTADLDQHRENVARMREDATRRIEKYADDVAAVEEALRKLGVSV